MEKHQGQLCPNKKQQPTPGVVVVGDNVLTYHIAGEVQLQMASGLVITEPVALNDVNSYVMASALGYGRQPSLMMRDRLLLHCLYAQAQGMDAPHWLLNDDAAVHQRTDMLLRILNCVSPGQQYLLTDLDMEVLNTARHLLRGQDGHHG